MKHFFTLFLFLFLALTANAQSASVRYTQADVSNFNDVMLMLSADKEAPTDELVIKTAMYFMGTPYVSGTLEQEPEKLTVNTRQTDCILFVETCLALSLEAKKENPSFDGFCDILRDLRYRDGIVDGYASRKHYTSEWIAEGEKMGILQEITSETGGTAYEQNLSFMSAHPSLYKQLKDDRQMVERIAAIEKRLNERQYYVIGKDAVVECENLIQDGDIICYNSSVKGLDIAHVCFAYRVNGKLKFIHASSSAGKVIISKESVAEYVKASKSINGIRVVRLK